MEHRCSERIAVALPVLVRTIRGEIMRGTIQDLSCGGAFLSVPASSALPRGLVELHVRLPYAEPQACHWRAYVVHQQEGGVGVMFDERHLSEVLPYIGAERIAARVNGLTARLRPGDAAGRASAA
jgi:hypothetical protein